MENQRSKLTFTYRPSVQDYFISQPLFPFILPLIAAQSKGSIMVDYIWGGVEKLILGTWELDEPITVPLSQLSTRQAVSPKLEQHTHLTWEAQLKCPMHNKVGR